MKPHILISIGMALLGLAPLFATAPAQAFYVTDAESCTPVDFRAEFPMKMRHQGNVSWCYAHTSADYLQLYFKLPTQISAADIAVRYNRRKWPSFLRWIRSAVVAETGFSKIAMRDTLNDGYCPEEYFPSERWSKRYVIGDKKGQSESVELMDAIRELVTLKDAIEMGLYKSPAEVPYVYEFKGVTDAQFFEVLSQSTNLNVMDHLRVAACDGHRLPFPAEVGAIGMRLKGLHAFEHINAVLDTHTPVSIDYFSGFLENARHFSHALGHLHTSLLIGRRFNEAAGECQYLIKNSYGDDCDDYDPAHECQGGNLWVSESGLYKAMLTYVYFKDPLLDDSGADVSTPSRE